MLPESQTKKGAIYASDNKAEEQEILNTGVIRTMLPNDIAEKLRNYEFEKRPDEDLEKDYLKASLMMYNFFPLCYSRCD